MGNLGVEIHTLPRLLAAFLGREDLQLAHNLQTVGQLDQDHTRILRVADNHIAEVVGLLLRDLEFDVGDLAQPHDDAQHRLAEAFAYLARDGINHLGLLLVGDAKHIVQNGGHRRVTTEANLACSNLGNGNVVVQKRGAIVAGIALHTLRGVDQGIVDGLLRLLRVGRSYVAA